MARPCETCRSDNRSAVDIALTSGKPAAAVASNYGLSRSSVTRHQARCIPARLVRAAESREELTAKGLVDKLLWYITEAENGVEIATTSGDLTGLARCLKEAHAMVLSVGRTVGVWSDRKQSLVDNRRVSVNLSAISDEQLQGLLSLRESLKLTG